MRKFYIPKGCDQQGRYASGWYSADSFLCRLVRKLREQVA